MAAKNHEGEKQDLVSQNIFERYDIEKGVWEKLPCFLRHILVTAYVETFTTKNCFVETERFFTIPSIH